MSAWLLLADRFAAMTCQVGLRCASCRLFLAGNHNSDPACLSELVSARDELGLGWMTYAEIGQRLGIDRTTAEDVGRGAEMKMRKRLEVIGVRDAGGEFREAYGHGA